MPDSVKSYAIGPKLGDFIHALVVPAWRWISRGEKAAIWMCEEGDKWSAGMERTYTELIPIMEQQPWVDRFRFSPDMKPEEVDFFMPDFRKHPRLFFQPFSHTYLDLFADGDRLPKNFAWLKYPPMPGMQWATVCHRGYPELSSEAANKRYLGLESMNPASMSLSDLFALISGSLFFVGDQSAPAAIASALGKPRMIELNRRREFLEGENTTDAIYF